MKEIKFSEEVLNNIRLIQSDYQQIAVKLGQLEIEKKILDAKQKELDALYQSITISEKKLLDNIRANYGEGVLNLESGTFIPNS